jgi:sec-independent protein translocase protein TatA
MKESLLFISGGEIIVVFLVFLLLFGSKKIPEFAKGLGKGLSEFKKATDDIKREINESTKEVTKEVNEVKKDLNAP